MSSPHPLVPLQHALPCSPTFPSPTRQSPPVLKRGRSPEPQPSLLFDSFNISDASTQLQFHPRRIIPRSSLPLSYLDLSTDSSLCYPSRMFLSDNPSLVACLRQRFSQTPSVLIASSVKDSQLYAIELLTDGFFTLCQLLPSLNLEHLQSCDSHGTLKTPSLSVAQNPTARIEAWWSQAAVLVNCSSRPPESNGSNANEHLNESQSPLRKPSRPVAADATIDTAGRDTRRLTEPKPKEPLVESDSELILEKVLCDVVMQYLELLYVSKASVAYFAKSTLSRARAFAVASQDTATTPKTLAIALQDMVLTSSTFDKKYDSRLPEILKTSLKKEADEANFAGASRPKLARAKRLKKPKPGKDGVYPIETEHLTKWWHNDSTASTKLDDSSLRARFAGLRHRESLIQIVLILEIMALEASTVASEVHHDGLTLDTPGSAIVPTLAGPEGSKFSATARNKKRKNLDTSLEMLVDKVCIWDSVDFVSDTSPIDKPAPVKGDGPGAASQRSDKLKDFCVDILIPFFAHRLPKKVEEIARRLGVSVKPAQHKRPELPNKRRKTEPVAPGSHIRRPPLQHQRKAISRVNSDIQRTGALPTPSLSRASTDTILLEGIKRERSSTPHDDPRTARRPFSRTSSISSSRTFNQREVDLTALNNFKANRGRPKPSVDQELKDAIAVLKKPNRTVTARKFADASDRRAPHGRVPKRSAKSKLDVEIGVTPRKVERNSDLGFSKPTSFRPAQLSGTSPETVPSSNPFVPASATRVPGSVTRRNFANVFETPSRGPSKKINVFQTDAVDESPEDRGDVIPQSAVKAALQSSPSLVKKQPAAPQPNFTTMPSMHQAGDEPVDTPMKPTSTGRGSIYEVLGWDDDDDDELQ